MSAVQETGTARHRGTGRRSVWLAAWPLTAVFMLSNAPTPMFVLWQQRIGFGTGTLTVVFASYIGGLLVALPVAGVLSDRYGRRTVLVPAVLSALLACLLYATAGSVAALIAARLLTGLAVGGAVAAGMAAVSDVGGPDRRRQASLAGSVAMGTGLATGPLLAGCAAQLLPAPTVTVFVAEAVLLLSALLVIRTLPQVRRDGGGSWLRLPSVPRPNRRDLLAGLAAYMPGMTGTSFLLALGPSMLADLLGTTNRIVAGGSAFVMFGASTAVQFFVSRWRPHRLLATATGATAAGMLLVILAVRASSIWLLLAAAVLAGIGQGMGQLGGFSLLNGRVPGPRLAEANAALSAWGYLFAGILPVGTGYLSDAKGIAFSSSLLGVVVAGAALVGMGFVVRLGRRG
ncbi:MFS transporter [Streptomyces eurocidicus]|uniref:MFS family permease n=1 Tax=Streptomyces eurocidicus TaxID=66423 RepID=A0A2N8NPQ5_STREU|nr:MFS transporter [Streptomyces eurocidicus]MBB5119493.1 MFS family permease [Streptomyces eurocidicus]MBF6054356.1 MFS transporter [Streptomyces eurocidicus]PNE30749.1 MFS transporter [Streptomyces eurocidicus]